MECNKNLTSPIERLQTQDDSVLGLYFSFLFQCVLETNIIFLLITYKISTNVASNHYVVVSLKTDSGHMYVFLFSMCFYREGIYVVSLKTENLITLVHNNVQNNQGGGQMHCWQCMFTAKKIFIRGPGRAGDLEGLLISPPKMFMPLSKC